MKTSTMIVIVLSVLSLSASLELGTASGKMYPPIRSGQQGQAFVEPWLVYQGNIKGQTVMIDYSKGVDPKATKVEFMIFFDIGDAQTSGYLVYNFIKVQNSKEFHYNVIAGRTEGTYWDSYSETFTFPTDGTNKVTLSIEKAFGGLNHGVSLYVVAYYL